MEHTIFRTHAFYVKTTGADISHCLSVISPTFKNTFVFFHTLGKLLTTIKAKISKMISTTSQASCMTVTVYEVRL